MFRRWAGPLITTLILGGVALIIALNVNPGGAGVFPGINPRPRVGPAEAPVPAAKKPAGFREYPIGEPQVVAGMKIAAVWLPPIEMEGMADAMSSDVIHL